MDLARSVAAILVAGTLLIASPASAQDGWAVTESPHSVSETVERLRSAIEGAGASVVAEVDHSAAAQEAGMDLPPTVLLIFGNPELGTPLMMEDRRAAIDLPLKVLVWQEGSSTRIGHIRPEILFERYGIAADHESVEKMQGALASFTDAATAP